VVLRLSRVAVALTRFRLAVFAIALAAGIAPRAPLATSLSRAEGVVDRKLAAAQMRCAEDLQGALLPTTHGFVADYLDEARRVSGMCRPSND
jgi:hypothetical protein